MNRRDFLRVLAGATTAAGLLVPSTTKIFLPPRGGWPIQFEYDPHGLEVSFDLYTGTFSNNVASPVGLTLADIERIQREICKVVMIPRRYLLGEA